MVLALRLLRPRIDRGTPTGHPKVWSPAAPCFPLPVLLPPPTPRSSPCTENLLAPPSSPESARLSLCLPLTTLLSLEAPCRPQRQGASPSFVRLPRSQGRAADPTLCAPRWRWSVLVTTPAILHWRSSACAADSSSRLSSAHHGLRLLELCHPRSWHPASSQMLE